MPGLAPISTHARRRSHKRSQPHSDQNRSTRPRPSRHVRTRRDRSYARPPSDLLVRAGGTKKLRDRMKTAPAAGRDDESTTVLGDWFVSALFWKPQVALLVNSRTFLPVYVPLVPAKTLLDRIPDAIESALRAQGVPEEIIAAERAAMSEVRLAPTSWPPKATSSATSTTSATTGTMTSPSRRSSLVATSTRSRPALPANERVRPRTAAARGATRSSSPRSPTNRTSVMPSWSSGTVATSTPRPSTRPSSTTTSTSATSPTSMTDSHSTGRPRDGRIELCECLAVEWN